MRLAVIYVVLSAIAALVCSHQKLGKFTSTRNSKMYTLSSKSGPPNAGPLILTPSSSVGSLLQSLATNNRLVFRPRVRKSPTAHTQVSRGGLVRMAAWHFPSWPVGPASRWAVTSNVEVWVKRLTPLSREE